MGFAQFEARWLERLRNGAKVAFDFGSVPHNHSTPHAIADAFVSSFGLEPIGFNWELLDPSGDASAPRSALGEVTKALSGAISNPSEPWLSPKDAAECARDFLSFFEPGDLVVLANRYDGLWNPISGAANEWGFVAFDSEHIALFLIAD